MLKSLQQVSVCVGCVVAPPGETMATSWLERTTMCVCVCVEITCMYASVSQY